MVVYSMSRSKKRFLHLYLKTSIFFISSTSFFCAIRSMFLKNQSCLDSLLNQRKGPYYSKASIQSLCSIKERIHAIQRILYKQRWLYIQCHVPKKRFLYLYLKTSSFFISSTSFFCAIRSMFLNEIW